jgi:hypothetical protein
MQKGELFGLPSALGVEILLEPANDLDDRPGARAVEPNHERVPVPTASNVFAAESPIDQSAQVSSQASCLDVIEPFETGRLEEAERVRATVSLSG